MPKPNASIIYDLKLVRKADRTLVRVTKRLVKLLDPSLEVQPLVDCNFSVASVDYHTEVIPLHSQHIKELADQYPNDATTFERKLRHLVGEVHGTADEALKKLATYLVGKVATNAAKGVVQVGACYFTDGTCQDNWTKAGCVGHPLHDHWDSNPCQRPRGE